jgi:hypothetical protein
VTTVCVYQAGFLKAGPAIGNAYFEELIQTKGRPDEARPLVAFGTDFYGCYNLDLPYTSIVRTIAPGHGQDDRWMSPGTYQEVWL